MYSVIRPGSSIRNLFHPHRGGLEFLDGIQNPLGRPVVVHPMGIPSILQTFVLIFTVGFLVLKTTPHPSFSFKYHHPFKQ